MMKTNIHWKDLYIADLGSSQIKDKKELALAQKKIGTLYKEFLLPLYIPIQNSKNFKFSVTDDKLTCRIMLNDLINFYGIKSDKELLEKIAESRPELTPQKIDKLLVVMQGHKEEKHIK